MKIPYKTSKDYNLLKELLDKGYSIPVYMNGRLLPASLKGTFYNIGATIAISKYSPSMPFEVTCETLKIEFIEPTENKQ